MVIGPLRPQCALTVIGGNVSSKSDRVNSLLPKPAWLKETFAIETCLELSASESSSSIPDPILLSSLVEGRLHEERSCFVGK